jgi:hypothetical protein
MFMKEDFWVGGVAAGLIDCLQSCAAVVPSFLQVSLRLSSPSPFCVFFLLHVVVCGECGVWFGHFILVRLRPLYVKLLPILLLFD